MLKRRSSLHVPVILFIFALLFTACAVPVAPAPAADGGDVAAGTTELVVWAEGNTVNTIEGDPEGQGKYGKYLIEKFEEEHPGVTVKLEYHGWDEELRQNLVTALLGEQRPRHCGGRELLPTVRRVGRAGPAG